ncbi:hypothetical protein QWY82_07340 [Simiduia curdlanivorans]|uniref:Uncharacterized protein n=1 Tax=Simiduia curdlanivorans TaxID=1492769 RepID=A0ABV8V5U2_9GAMM|nr:hypothetical protein [Simiduia curdlanivorans]MDN3638615.1 hypothetical protein [Simiduia curdlanivorans]
MKYSNYFSLILFTSFTLGALITAPAQAQESAGSDCPTGFYSTLPGVCVASSLNSDTITPLSSANGCPSTYEHTPGTQFCSRPNVALNWENEHYLVTGPVHKDCPSNFSRVPGSQVCIATHLSLALVDRTLTLLAPKLACPQGFEQLPKARSCTAIQTGQGQATDASIAMPDCAPGFIKPPHVHFCIAYSVARNTSDRVNFGITPPAGDCPTFWTKHAVGGFCLPISTAVSCGPGSFPCTHRPGDKVAIVDDPGCCPDSSTVIIGHMPGFNGDGALDLTAKPVVMCLPPGEGEHLNCVGLPDFDLTN